MRVSRLFHMAVAVMVFATLGASNARAGSKFRVITEGEFGFKRGNTFFSLKMNGADFETKFGPAEKRTKLTDGFRLAYLAEGVCAVTEQGKLRSLTFIVVPGKTERFQEYQAANITTSNGINRETSISDVIKTEGEPAAKEDYPSLGRTVLRYKSHGQEYSFTFKDGALAQIVLSLPRV